MQEYRGIHYETVALSEDGKAVVIIDQTQLPPDGRSCCHCPRQRRFGMPSIC